MLAHAPSLSSEPQGKPNGLKRAEVVMNAQNVVPVDNGKRFRRHGVLPLLLARNTATLEKFQPFAHPVFE
jgi:hypothetical protein